jgi:hypothetical protein
LQSSARNHATRFPMFFSSSKEVKNTFWVCSLLSMFYLQHLASRRRVWGLNLLPCRKQSTNHWHTYHQLTEQRNSPLGCTVRPETSTEQSSLRGLYVVQDLNAGRQENCSPVSI